MKTQSAKKSTEAKPGRRAGPSLVKAERKSTRPSAPPSPTGVFNGKIDPARYPALDVRLEKISKLLADPRNSKLHPKRSIEAIRASLRAFGQRKNIVVTKDGEVKAGNGTLEAARLEGWTHIVVGPAPVDLVKARFHGANSAERLSASA